MTRKKSTVYFTDGHCETITDYVIRKNGDIDFRIKFMPRGVDFFRLRKFRKPTTIHEPGVEEIVSRLQSEFCSVRRRVDRHRKTHLVFKTIYDIEDIDIF